MDADERLFLKHIDDLFSIAYSKNIVRFSSFLDESRIYKLEAHLKHPPLSYMLYGGYDGAVRKMLGVFPDYMEPDPSAFPLTPLTVTYKKEYPLTHRDFLGALMHLNLKRETIGDIVVGEGKTVLFVQDSVCPCVQNELHKVARVGVELTPGLLAPVEHTERFEEITATAASLRLDVIVSIVTRLSREKAAALIKSGAVQLNYVLQTAGNKAVKPEDVFTVRGYGKFVFCAVSGTTRKDRLHIQIKKYI